jgi:4-azaleucine resistance transporter AzlC
VLFSLGAFAGSAEYMAIAFLTLPFDPLLALGMALMVNARHVFYGISLMERYKTAGKLKPYLIFGLCDETFSLICSAKPEEGVDPNLFAFFITLLNHLYWVTGTLAGGLLGGMVTFDTKGLDFVLTALFVVIFTGQWKNQRDHRPALIGLGCTGVPGPVWAKGIYGAFHGCHCGRADAFAFAKWKSQAGGGARL